MPTDFAVVVDIGKHRITWLTRAAKFAPNSRRAHYQLGKSHFDLGHFENARQEAEKAVRSDPDDSSDHHLLARIYQRSGNTARWPRNSSASPSS